MIVDDLHVVSVSVIPHKANPPLVIDTDTVLARAVSFQSMEPVASGRQQVRQSFGRLQHQHFAPRRLPDVRKPWDRLVMEKSLRIGTFEGLNHTSRI
jgi:hypothetical protein